MSRKNEAFRQWTRGLSFTLSMGKLQVATLVSIHASQTAGGLVGCGHPRLSNFITGGRCLIDRGLVTHSTRRAEGAMWQCTEAGELVVGLLKLSGVYDELLEELKAHDSADRARWRRSA